MLKAFALSAISIALCGCALGAPDSALTVDEVMADITSVDSQLDGQEVEIRGWLGQCGGLDCAIYPTLEDARLVADGDWETPEWSHAMDRRLDIGSSDTDFDFYAMPMQFSEVVVRGTVNAQWKKPVDENGNKFGCFDRCNDINPIAIKLLVF